METILRLRPVDATVDQRKPTQTNALSCVFGAVSRSAIFQGLIRDEEAAGSFGHPHQQSKVPAHLRGREDVGGAGMSADDGKSVWDRPVSPVPALSG